MQCSCGPSCKVAMVMEHHIIMGLFVICKIMSIANRDDNGENAYAIRRCPKMMNGWSIIEHVKDAWDMLGMMSDELMWYEHAI